MPSGLPDSSQYMRWVPSSASMPEAWGSIGGWRSKRRPGSGAGMARGLSSRRLPRSTPKPGGAARGLDLAGGRGNAGAAMRPRALAFLALLAASCALGGCSANPATGSRSFTAFMSPEEEARLGRQEHPKIVAQFGGEHGDQRLRAYVSRLGDALAARSEMPGLEWRFTILDSDVVNAFALPGGHVYATRALLALASSEAELAGVLGHEIGHVTARHTAQRYSSGLRQHAG